MDAPKHLLFAFPSLRCLACALAITLAAPAAEAQPGASWSESGTVDILVYAEGSASRTGREAADVLESDVIDEIEVGKTGLLANQETGTLTIEGVGEVGAPRDLGDVFVLVGTLYLNDAIVGSSFIRIGSVISTAQTDPSQGTLSVLLSDVSDAVTVRNGNLSCQASRMQNVTVENLGHAQISGCVIEAISSTGLAEVSVAGSTINASLPNFRGNTTISGGTITSAMGTVVEGTIQIGNVGEPTDWDASGTITVGQNVHTTDMIVYESAIESNVAYVRGDGDTSLVLQGAATWRAIDLFQFQGATVTADVNSASHIESLGDLWIGASGVTVGSTTGDDSHIDVDGDLELGRFSASVVSSGTLTIEDGGYVDVGGTLTIHPLATLNLDGGTLRVGVLDNQGTLNENGGTLIVPEPGSPGIAALLAVMALTRRRLLTRSRGE